MIFDFGDPYYNGQWELFKELSSIWHGKQYYFLEDDGTVYSRESGCSMSFDDAVAEFKVALEKECWGM